jgi:EAL domain-containing protein (putative c-di-GMP-specific phosphodiesterase class I)/GGDEF domain-containing protein
MPDSGFIQSLPELILLVRRDGTLLQADGGRGVLALAPLGSWDGDDFAPAWSESATALIAQLVRRAIADRAASEARFEQDGRIFEIRATAIGQDRCTCVIRAAGAGLPMTDRRTTNERSGSEPDRRGFLRRLKDAISAARLREKPLAVAVIHIEDVTELGRVIAPGVSENIVRTALRSVLALAESRPAGEPEWDLGLLRDSQLALCIDSADRDRIEVCVARVCAQLCEPVAVGPAQFQLVLHAGVAILGLDATAPQVLVDHASVAAGEARRAASSRVFFFSDTLKMKSLARLDIARELRAAIDQGHFRLRYRFRHHLLTGERTAWVGYVGWTHPLRGAIPPSEFLPVAQSMGLATALSRSVLHTLHEDFARLANEPAEVRLSFGALRAHALDERFLTDVRRAIVDNALPAERLEIRLAESAAVSRDPSEFLPLRDLGVRIVADELGRELVPLPRLAGAPLWGLQLDRAWGSAVPGDLLASRICTAVVGVAKGLGFTPLASGVDSAAHRDALLGIGCEQGSGDLFGGP